MNVYPLYLSWIVACLAACNSSNSLPAQPSDPLGQKQSSTESPELVRERTLAQGMARVLETEHLRRQRLDDSVSELAFRNYLDQLDPGKLFLLEKHVSQLKTYMLKMDDQMRSGRLALAHLGGSLLGERLAVTEKMVEQLLARPFDFTRDESLETDPDKRPFCQTDDQLKERWRKVLKLQVLIRMVRMEDTARLVSSASGAKTRKGDGKKPASADAEKKPTSGRAATTTEPKPAGGDQAKTIDERQKQVRAELAKDYATRFTRLAQAEPIDRIEAFINAIAGVYDPHTLYLPPSQKENFDIRMSGTLEGIGALLAEDEHYIRVAQIVPGSASWRQGELEAGDLIVAVAEGDGEPVDIADMRINDVVKRIRGQKGTVVTLTVQKPDGRTLVIAITRDVVKIESAYAKGAVLKHRGLSSKVGYIYLPSFYGNTRTGSTGTPDRRCTDDVRRLLGIFADRGVDAAILDLRSNGGGLLRDAEEMSGLFIETGPIVQTRAVDGSHQILRDRDPSIAFRGHLVVLVDRFSASAAEILAAALQDYRRAVIVGTGPTHGKGTVQVLVSLDELVGSSAGSDFPLGVLKLTRMQFYRISGASTQRRGVVPDVVVADPASHIESSERHLDHSIPWNAVEPLSFSRWPNSLWDVRVLADRSRERQDKSPTFSAIVERGDALRARRAQTQESLNLVKWRENRQRERDQLEAISRGPEKEPARFSVNPIDYDGSAARRTKRPRPNSARRDKPGGKRDDIDPWIHNLARDVWVEESLFVLRDMAAAR
ncbi:MAG: carboxy terminal-processing peptidase [Proteobacteria bacterium]|nr:carboxy terminal-processing peptidase [Pseudomonadota bacterium]